MVIMMEISGAIAISQQVMGMFPPLAREWKYFWNKAWSNQEMSVQEGAHLLRRGIINQNDFHRIAKTNGIDDKQANTLYEGTKQLLNAGDLLVLKRKGKLKNEDYYKRMVFAGFNKSEADDFEERNKFIPSPQDLVSWTGKEVYEPEIVTKFGLDNEFEKLDLSDFAKAGVDEEFARKFWIAHWQHPSVYKIQDMLHRAVIDKDTVQEWMKLVEFPPYWRDALVEVMYNPLTRVDVRRMYSVGVLNNEEVFTSFKELGYNDVNAKRMTNFTIESSRPAERDLTRTMIEKAYVYAEISKEETIEQLIRLGYDQAESELLLALKDKTEADKELKMEIDTIKTQFKNGIIDRDLAVDKFTALDVSARRLELLLSQITKEKEKEFKLPSKEDLAKFFKGKIIDKSQFVSYMGRIGYMNNEIAFYIKMIEQKIK